jgi:hypothetical protein
MSKNRHLRGMVFMAAAALLLNGCLLLPFLVGAGVVTGYVAFKDSAAGNLDTTFDDLWNAAISVLEREADEIVLEDTTQGIIKAEKGTSEITVRVIEFTSYAYKLRVTARRQYALANLELAQDIFTRIVRQVPPLKKR